MKEAINWVAGLDIPFRQRALLYAIARWSDPSGVTCGLSKSDIARELSVSVLWVKRQIREARAAGLLTVEQFNLGRRRLTRFNLALWVSPVVVSLCAKLPKLAPSSLDVGLRAALAAGVANGFQGHVGVELMASIENVLARAVETGRIRHFDKSFATVAWIEAASKAPDLLSATNPEDLLIRFVFRHFDRLKTAPVAGPAYGADISDKDHAPLYYASADYRPNYDDMLEIPAIRTLVQQLIGGGMTPVIAFAGTLRILEICISSRWSYQHTAAAKDPFLAAIGVSPKMARRWVTLIIGSRSVKDKTLTLVPNGSDLTDPILALLAA